MIVYGDPSFYVQAGALARHLLTVESSRPGADDLRYLLIAAGQLEQAVADEPALAGHCQAAERATDGAARAFLAAAGSGDPAPKLAESTAALESLVGVTAPVRVKQPEGYAFYALYPEQYLAATDEWLREGAPEPGSLVLVVGVRSIGTSLSALVAAALERSGLRTRRCTVRPAGHPYERRVSLPRRVAEGAAYGIAVDEGPGQSGSSLAATVAALSEAGLAWERIALLPGHAGKPGEAASPEVREVWGRVARYSVPLGDLSWGGRALTAELAGATEAACGAPCTGVEDLGWGAWRELAYPGREWPPAALPFERPKYLVSLGDGRRALWKFAGLGTGPGLVPTAEAARRRLHRLAALGWTVEAAGMHLGFVAVPWVEGARPGREDREAARAAGRYVAAACGEELAAPEIEAGFERLAEMLYWNAWEGLGEEPAGRARRLADAARSLLGHQDPRRYGDGRLDPCEWVRTGDGRLLKTDAAGHDHDHTVVGPQPLAWDLAGALVEWEDRAAVQDGFTTSGGHVPARPLLNFYGAAYCAFRLGLARMSAFAAGGDDAARLEDAGRRYAARLGALLAAVR